MSMNLGCCALVDGKKTRATINLIQTPTAITYSLLAYDSTFRIANAYLAWVRSRFQQSVYEDERENLGCVLDNPDSFKFDAL